MLEKQSLVCFLILPGKFIESHFDNLAITKNYQKGLRAAGDPIIHPLSGVETCTWGGPAWLWNLPLNIFGSKDLKRWTESAEAKARNSAKTKLFWGKFPPHLEDKQWTADCWPWSARIVGSVEMIGHVSAKQQPFNNQSSKANNVLQWKSPNKTTKIATQEILPPQGGFFAEIFHLVRFKRVSFCRSHFGRCAWPIPSSKIAQPTSISSMLPCMCVTSTVDPWLSSRV